MAPRDPGSRSPRFRRRGVLARPRCLVAQPRGLAGVKLVISDEHDGLVNASERYSPGSAPEVSVSSNPLTDRRRELRVFSRSQSRRNNRR